MSRKKILTSDYEKVVDMYNNGMTQQEIANIYGCSKQIVYKIMKQMRADARPNGFTKEDAERMYKMYQDGMSMSEIADKFDSCRHTIGRTLKRHGFQVDRLKYHCNENYFDIIDTHEKAYILGLLWSDGCNDTRLGKIQLQLQEGDMQVLEKINELINNDRPLYFTALNDKNSNWHNTYTLVLKSYHMSEVLAGYGMIPRKSLVLQFPDFLDKSLYKSFIRGYFDGDGNISYNCDTKVLNVGIIGTNMFLNSIQTICRELDIKTFLSKKNENDSTICSLGITNKTDRIKFLNWIYDGASIKIERKYLKYQQVLNDHDMNNSLTS